MSWHFSQALEAAYSEANCSDGGQSAPLRMTNIAEGFSCRDKLTVALNPSPCGTMCEPSTEDHGGALLTWFLEGFRARTSVLPEKEKAFMALARDCGTTWRELSLKLDQSTHSWKTHHCLFTEDLPESSVILPLWGMMLNGEFWERITLPRRTSEKGFGWWPTPCSRGTKGQGGAVGIGGGKRAKDALDKIVGVEMRKKLCSGLLNPVWSEWYLLGWPMHWTDITPLETGKFQEWLLAHGRF